MNEKLKQLIQSILKTNNRINQISTINFRDPDYSAKRGGYHPVEMMIDKDGSVLYITDFAFVGSGAYAELSVELDFNFENKTFEQMGRTFPLSKGMGLFQIWQKNFLMFHSMEVFTVEVS